MCVCVCVRAGGAALKKIAPCQVCLHLAGFNLSKVESQQKKEKLKEISASLLPWAWRNKPSIFAPGDLQEDMHINHPACTCPKTQPQSPVSSHLRSRYYRGSSSSLNQCARGHRELCWHSWRRGQRREITFPSLPLCTHCSQFTCTVVLLRWRPQISGLTWLLGSALNFHCGIFHIHSLT